MANTARLVIDPVSRKITTKYEKIRLVQHDNNSTRVTFEMPRYVRGHDMSRCSTVEVHYDNISIDRKQKRSDVYVVTDIIVAPEDDETINFSWLVSRGATQIVGNLDFSLHFGCNEDPDLEYAWHTTPYSGIVVLEGKHNTPSVVEKHPDLVASILDYVDKKISEFDAVDIAQETGESTEAVMSQKATTDALGGKVDKVSKVSGVYVYTTEANGQQTVRQSTNTPKAYVVPMTDANGNIKTNAPVEDLDVANKKYVDDVAIGKVDKDLTGKGRHRVYGVNGDTGAQKLYNVGHYNKHAEIPVYADAKQGEVGKQDYGATFAVAMPLNPYQAAPKKYVDDGLAGRVPTTNETYKIYGTRGKKEDGSADQGFFSLNGWGTTVGDVVQYRNPNETNWNTQTPKSTIGVCDPIKPIQAANRRFVENTVAPIANDVAVIWDALGGAIEYASIDSTTNPVIVPSNVFNEANIDKIGTGIRTEASNEAVPSTSSPSDAPTGVIASYDAENGLYTISSDVKVAFPITFPISPLEVAADELVYVSIEVVSGSFEGGNQNGLVCGTYYGAYTYINRDDRFSLRECVISESASIPALIINLAPDQVKFNDFTFRLHIGKQKQTYGIPVASIKKGEETIYTVPEEIRALTYSVLGDSQTYPVYGLALSDTVYNYLDLEEKKYVVKCYEDFTGEIAETNATIDVSAYLTDEDGEVTVAAGDEILFVDAEGNSAGNTVPNTITYAVKKGG